VWWQLVQAGEVCTPWELEDEPECMALMFAIRAARLRDDPSHLVIDTWKGSRFVWRVSTELERTVWNCTVLNAHSAGLILACSCRGHRKALADASFLFHSLDMRDFGAEDERRAQWFAQRTTQPVDFWRDLCAQGETRFGAEDALAWGVVHEII